MADSDQHVPTDLALLWQTEYARLRPSRDRIAECTRWRRSQVQPTIPWADGAAFAVKLPHAITLGQDVANFLARKPPVIRRPPLGSDPAAQRVASRIETWLQAAMTELRSGGTDLWAACIAAAAHDGEFAVLVQPAPSHWASLVDFTTAEDGQDVIAPVFRRDSKGRAEDDDWYTEKRDRRFQVDSKASAKAYDDYAQDAKARRIPFVARVLPATQCLPIGLDPLTGRVDSLLVRSVRTATSLKRDGFRWLALGAGTETAVNEERLTLYELWVPGRVSYQISGRERYDTRLNESGAVVDLEKEFRLREVPGGYFYGSHLANEMDPAYRGIPLLWPFLPLLAGANQMLSAKLAYAHQVAFGGWFSRLAADDVATWTEMGRPTSTTMQPGQVNFIVGDLTPAVHPGTGRDVDEFLSLSLNLLRDAGPGGMAPSNDQSGFAQSVSIASAESALSQISQGARAAWKRIAECLLEQASWLSNETGAPVPVYAHTDEEGRKRDHVEISASNIQDDYRVEVAQPNQKFQNLALMQAGAGWVDSGKISQTTWLQDMAGFEQPEEEQDRVWVERQLASPEGQQYVLKLAAQYSDERGLLDLQQLQDQGKVTPGGTPTAMMPPPPPPSGMDGVSGPNTGNPAAAALGGIMAGASMTAPQSAVIQATGQPAEVAA